jgi:hypothetical protein
MGFEAAGPGIGGHARRCGVIRRLLFFLFSFAVSAAVSLIATYVAVVRPMRRTWGVDPEESAKSLPGDELVPEAALVETRGITVNATPAAIWPWLVQMGYGRGGWYSYDKMDNDAASSDRILPEFQSLSVGDIMPTWPGGGFRVAGLDPERSLSLYLDTELVKSQQAAAEGAPPAETTPGLKAAGAMGGMAMPEFKASWTFVLEPQAEGKTRIVERMRAWAPEPSAAQKLALPIFGIGVFLMTRKQLLGLKDRVERPTSTAIKVEPVTTEPAPATDAESVPEATATA